LGNYFHRLFARLTGQGDPSSIWDQGTQASAANQTKIIDGVEKIDDVLALFHQSIGGCILPNDDGSYGFKITQSAGLVGAISPGKALIGGKLHQLSAPGSLTFDATKAALGYVAKQATVGNLVPTFGKINAAFPALHPNAVIAFNFTEAGSPVDLVDGNDITTMTDCQQIDGWVGKAKAGNGTTSVMISQGSAGFVAGASARAELLFVRAKALSGVTVRYIKAYGNYHLYTEGTRLKVKEQSTVKDTGFDLVLDKWYFIVVQYTGTILEVYVDAVPVYSVAVAFNTTAGALHFFRNTTAANYNQLDIQYYEMIAGNLTAAEIGLISNQFIIPCRYVSGGVERTISMDILPADSISIGFVPTDATGIISAGIDCSDDPWINNRYKGTNYVISKYDRTPFPDIRKILTKSPTTELLVENGWKELDGGFIMQWGIEASYHDITNANIAFVFPIAFEEICLTVLPVLLFSSGGPTGQGVSVSGVPTVSGFTAATFDSAGGAQSAKVQYQAIGR
jgi:hypothetical protein